MSDHDQYDAPDTARPHKRRRTRSPSPTMAVALAEAKLVGAVSEEESFEFEDDGEDDDDFAQNAVGSVDQAMGEPDRNDVLGTAGDDDEDDLVFHDVLLPTLAPASLSARPSQGADAECFGNASDDDNLAFEDVAILTPQPDWSQQQSSMPPSPLSIPIPTNLSTIEFTLPLNPADSQGSNSQKKRRTITKADRISRLTVHRLHLLSLLASAHLAHRHTFQDETVHALVVSLLPSTVATAMGLGSDQVRLGPLVTWLRSEFTADPMLPWPDGPEAIALAIVNRVGHPSTLVLAVAALLWHVVGVQARLVAGLNPIPLTFQGASLDSTTPAGSDAAPSAANRRTREVLVEKAATVYPLAFALEVPKGRGEWTPLHFHWTSIDRMAPTSSSYSRRRPASSSCAQPNEPPHPFDALKSSGGPHFVSPYVLALTHPPRRRSHIPRAKDVSVRYLTGLRGGRPIEDPKYRVPLDDPWWARIVSTAAATDVHAAEDQFLLEQLLVNAPFPTRLADYKDHRVYALERHLRKDEVIHPKEPVLGKIKGELIYPRANVKQVRSERVWVRQFGRQIREGERPVKETKARRKGKRGGDDDDDNDNDSQASEGGVVGLFGEWQTRPYVSTAQVDPVTGIVPTNEHGNVEVFHPSMVPRGGVHVTVPNAKRIAKDLAIPFAEAMVGFDFAAGGRTRPSIDGIVVAEHAAPIIEEAAANLAAAQREQEMASHKQRIAMRWVMFAKGLVAREQVKRLFARTGATGTPRQLPFVGGDGDASSDDHDTSDDDTVRQVGPRLRRRRAVPTQGGLGESDTGPASGSEDDDVEHPEVVLSTSDSSDDDQGSLGSSAREDEDDWDEEELGPRVRRRRPTVAHRADAAARLPPSFDEGGGGFM